MGVVLIELEELLSNFCFLVLRCDLQTSTTSISSILPDPHLQALWSSSDSSLDLFFLMRFNLFSRSLISHPTELVAAEKSCASSCLHWTYPFILPSSDRIVHDTHRCSGCSLGPLYFAQSSQCYLLAAFSTMIQALALIIRLALFRLGDGMLLRSRIFFQIWQ